MVGVDVETLGARAAAAGEERLLVRSPQLKAGDLIVTTHMPNAIEGLRVETLDEGRMARAPARPAAAAPDRGKTQAVQ